MRAKDTVALESLRAIKAEILLAQTASGSKEESLQQTKLNCFKISENPRIALKFTEQNRLDLAEPECTNCGY
jgi:uncharacterized protein YqeY